MSVPAPTERLEFHEVRPETAKQLRAGEPAGWTWIDGVPFEGTQTAAGHVVASADTGVYRPGWGIYVMVRSEDDVAVGGIGWHGPPSAGSVEVGYDLCVAARGHGYATEALQSVASWALHQPGVEVVIARTEEENLASQRVMERAGFVRVETDEELLHYEFGRKP